METSDHRSKLSILFIPAVIVVAVDQFTKYLVRTTPELQYWDIIPGWLSFHYTQNPGMALGMDWASTPVISSIAIVATLGILIYILKTLSRSNTAYLFCMGLILGGAFGNIIDRLFMARLEAYGTYLEGHVVDFIHFTLTIGEYPVFPYIFNVADIAISTAIITMLVFHRRIMPHDRGEEEEISLERRSHDVAEPETGEDVGGPGDRPVTP